MRTRLNPTPARLLALVVIGAVLGGALAARPGRVAAGRSKAPVVPAGALWCGITNDGGSVNLQLTADLRFVDWVEVRTARGIISTREGTFSGIGRAQIAESKFIFRQQHDEEECERERGNPAAPRQRCLIAPCRPGASGGGRPPEQPRTRCRTSTIEDLNIHGTFLTPDNLRGVYSAHQVIDPNASRGNGGRPIIRERLVTGTFVAWPTGTAPCP